ncbi:hypothetical protein [Vibrio owensii]|uniref:hypothetical protein n=1 Tax=Vibrio harveyi group TaxID=717610 RepID=UPI003CC64278
MKLHKKVLNLYKEISDSDSKFNHAFAGDDEYDVDMIINDAQAGDHFIGVLKGCGCGSYLNRIAVGDSSHNHANYTVVQAHADSKFFHIEVTGIDEGEVKEVSKEKAIELSLKFKENPSRKPRRKDLNTVMSETLEVPGMFGTRFFSEFGMAKGDTTAFKLSTDTMGAAMLQMARSKVIFDKGEDVACKKLSELYRVEVGFNKQMELLKEPQYFKLQVTKPPYVEVSPISKRVFDNAVKKAQKRLETGNELGM